MRPPRPDEPLDGPRADLHTTIRDAVPLLAATDRPVLAMDGDEVAGVVDRVAVLAAIAGEGG